MPKPCAHRYLRRLALLVGGLVVGLLLCEGFLRISGLEWRLLGEQLPRVITHISELSRPSTDPILTREPRPGASISGEGLGGGEPVVINAMGFRGPEYPQAKPPGHIRVMVYGGSNVIGSHVAEDQTWPATLERALHAAGRQDIEVWNGGLEAYNPHQICHRATLDAPRFEPDLVILALSNFDLPRHIHPSSPSVAAYFPGDAMFWREAFPASTLTLPGSPDGRVAIWLMNHSAIARLISVGRLRRDRLDVSGHHADAGAPPDLREDPARACIHALATQQRVLLFGAPATPSRIHHMYAQGSPVPVFTMDAAGHDPAWGDLHPVPEAYAWYGDTLAAHLLQSGLL